MSKRVITIDGIALLADKEDIYSIVSGTDGFEYIVEQDENGNNVWNLYKECYDDDLSVYKKNQVVMEYFLEDKCTLKKIPLINNGISKTELGKNEKKDICHDNIDHNGIVEHGIVEHGIVEHGIVEHGIVEHGIVEHGIIESKIIKKIVIKKQVESVAIESTIENTESLKKIVIKPKTDNIPDVKEPEKKLSKYHTFIKKFLALNSHIPWNERMKAANEAWKIQK